MAKDYKKYTDNWDIIPDNMYESSKYWIYMLCRHEEKLCEHYGIEKSDKIPDNWRKVDMEQARRSLTEGPSTR